MKAIDSITPIKKVRMKANSKPWFNTEIISVVQKKDKLYSRYKNSDLKTHKDTFNTSKIFFQKMLYRKQKLLLRKQKTFESLDLIAKEGNKSNISQNKNCQT